MAHVSLWLIKEQGLSISLREQIYLGQVLVVPDSPIYHEILPEYPYMFRSTQEMRTMLRYVVDNYWSDEVQGVREKYRAHIAKTYSTTARIDMLYDFLSERIEENAHVDNSIVELVRAAFDTVGWPETVTYDELKSIVRKGTITARPIETTYTGFGRNHFRWAMPELGYVDTYQTEKPFWIRENTSGTPSSQAFGIKYQESRH
jgi:hypothetical protein